MDKGCQELHAIYQVEQDKDLLENESLQYGNSSSKIHKENKLIRRPGRPPLRTKGRLKNNEKNHYQQNEGDEDFEQDKPKLKEKIYSYKQQKENSIDGFLKIVDYLKKIQCDEPNLHNKMNPFNLLTPTCFWYMISAQYFSFDFFNNKTPPHDIALQIVRKAQKTTIPLPLRILKPLKIKNDLQFQTPQLYQLSIPLTQKLTNLIQMPSYNISQLVQKSTILSSVVQDNYFRSTVRTILFNSIKKQIHHNQKWNSLIKYQFQNISSLHHKQFLCQVFEDKWQNLLENKNSEGQLCSRQRKVQKNATTQTKYIKQVKKFPQKIKKNNKKIIQDQIYDESQQQQLKKQNDFNQLFINQNQKYQQENIQHHLKQSKIQNYDFGMLNQNFIWQSGKSLKEQAQINNDDRQQQGILNQQFISYNKVYTQDDLLLESILHLPIDSVISILKSSIEPIKLPEIVRPYMPIPKNDPLQLVYQIHPQQQIFLDYMRDRQQKLYFQKQMHSELMIQQKQRQGQVQDAKCQVCTDGDYTDDNLIVFCSMCNISLHQRCVGLAKVPVDNWVCEVCASFGPSGINVPCPLCHVKGGALKRTSIHINTPLFKDTNPQYHQFAKKCPNYKHKQQYVNPNKVNNKGQEEPYYDYFSKLTYPSDQPICHFVWVHYVCTIWIPECYFEQKNGLINIKGIQNIDKRRFKQKCLVCKQIKGGACVKCDNQNCNKHYHPQCARKKKIYMQQLNLDKLKYLIFCEAHQPLQVKRKIQIKKKKQRDQIIKFCRGIEKYVQTYKIANLPFKLLKIGINQSAEQKKLQNISLTKKDKLQQSQLKINIKIQKNTDQDFVKSVIDGLIKQNQIIINLSVLSEGRYKIDQIIKPSKRDIRKSLTRKDQFWKNFKSIETSQSNLKRFNTIIRQNCYLREKIDNFINYGTNGDSRFQREQKGGKRGVARRMKEKVQTMIDQQGGIFCVCRKPYKGEFDMLQCEVCNEWYHYDCIGFIGSQQDARSIIFHCMKCLKFQSLDIKKQLLQKCSKYFSQDSLFLNYRPPTPSLQSSQQDIKNQLTLKKQPSQYKQYSIEIQKLQKISLIKKNNCYNSGQIDDQKINLQKPFIIFDPYINKNNILHRQKIQQITNQFLYKKIDLQTDRLKPQNPSIIWEDKNQMQIQDDKNYHWHLNDQQYHQKHYKNKLQFKQLQDQQNNLLKQPQNSNQKIINYSPSNSSLLMTPHFINQSYTFGMEDSQKLQKQNSIQNNINKMKQQQNNEIQFLSKYDIENIQNQNSDNYIKNNQIFHFKKQQIDKFKIIVQQQINSNNHIEEQYHHNLQKSSKNIL